MSKQNDISQVLELLNKLDTDVRETNRKLEEQAKSWDDRYFQLVKEQGQNSRTVINAAATVVIFDILANVLIQFTR